MICNGCEFRHGLACMSATQRATPITTPETNYLTFIFCFMQCPYSGPVVCIWPCPLHLALSFTSGLVFCIWPCPCFWPCLDPPILYFMDALIRCLSPNQGTSNHRDKMVREILSTVVAVDGVGMLVEALGFSACSHLASCSISPRNHFSTYARSPGASVTR